MKHYIRVQPKLMQLAVCATVTMVLVAVIAYGVLGKNTISIAVMTLFIGLTMFGLSAKQKGIVGVLSLLAIAIAMFGKDSIIVIALSLVFASAITVLADHWSASTVKILPGIIAYIGINATVSTPLAAVFAALLGFVAAFLFLQVFRINSAAPNAQEAQKPLAIVIFAALAIAFTVISMLNGWQHGYWMVLTLCTVLQLRGTTTRAIMWYKLAGTISGAIFALLVVEYLPVAAVMMIAVGLFVAAVYTNLLGDKQLAAASTTAAIIMLMSGMSTRAVAGIAGERIEFILVSLATIALASWLIWRLEQTNSP